MVSKAIIPQDVKVKILLAGGHHYTLSLKTDSPLLQALVKTLVTQTEQSTGFASLFQIPIDDGRSALCFPSEKLVGLVTDPPIYIQDPTLQPPFVQHLPQPEQEPVHHGIKKPIIQTSVPPTITDDLTSRFAHIDNFLTPKEHQELINYVIERERQFLPTMTSTNDANYRRSMVLHSFPEFSQLILQRVRDILPEVLSQLNLPTSFSIADIEAQLTTHNDGNYYKIHNDNGSPDTANRFFTYVYYFYREPKSFTGGQLRMYDSKVENNFYVAAETYTDIEPLNNRVVFFLSRYMHEVLPVSCPSQAFGDGRFTINGWVRRAD